MTLPYVKIAHTSLTPTILTVYCDNVTVSWKNNNDSKPNANGTAAADVNTQSFENPDYTLNNVRFLLANTSSLQYSHLLKLSKIKYDGTNAPILQVHYGKSGSEVNLVASDEVSTNIKVLVENWGFPIDVKQTVNGYMPIVNIKFKETG